MFKMEKGRVFKTYEEFEAALKSFVVALTVYLWKDRVSQWKN